MASKRNNFAVTGAYRVGTLWLATALNSSSDWTVGYEHNWLADSYLRTKERFDHIQGRLNHDHYGEVNSGLCWVFDKLDVAKKGVVLRDPRKCFISYMNTKVLTNKVMDSYRYAETFRMFGVKQYHLFDYEIAQLGRALKILDRCIEDGARPIQFSKMVSDVGYLQDVAEYLGVHDADCAAAIAGGPKHKQPSVIKVFKEVEDLPRPLQEEMAKMEWFVNKYEVNHGSA